MKFEVKVVNIRTYKRVPGVVEFRIDRQTPVGNPFPINAHQDRDKVCELYENYFNKEIAKTEDTEFKRYLNSIVQVMLSGKPIALGCWCYPKRCHGMTIRRYLYKIWLEEQKKN